MFSKVLTAFIMLMVATLTVMKLPKWIAIPIMKVPSWLQSLVLHFGYGGWVGGVTGHLVAGLMSIPWFFISELFLRPRILGIATPKINKLFAHPVAKKKKAA
jgi:thiamine transporter ThiT